LGRDSVRIARRQVDGPARLAAPNRIAKSRTLEIEIVVLVGDDVEHGPGGCGQPAAEQDDQKSESAQPIEQTPLPTEPDELDHHSHRHTTSNPEI
jgi:hypothetical protein